jgi:hypothetical protein
MPLKANHTHQRLPVGDAPFRIIDADQGFPERAHLGVGGAVHQVVLCVAHHLDQLVDGQPARIALLAAARGLLDRLLRPPPWHPVREPRRDPHDRVLPNLEQVTTPERRANRSHAEPADRHDAVVLPERLVDPGSHRFSDDQSAAGAVP